MMNQKANELGLSSSHFVTPHGLDNDNHFTTAYELAKIADYALNNPIFSKIVRTNQYTITISEKTKTLENTNELLGYLDGVYGVKTGFTNGANRCLVTSCKRGNLDIICVVLGCDTKKDRTLDSIKLINYAFNNFSTINIKNIITKNFNNWVLQNSNLFHINKGISSNLELYLNENQIPYENIAINNSLKDNIKTDFYFSKNFEAPLLQNTIIGYMKVYINDSNNFTIEVLNRNFIKRKTILYYLKFFIKNYFNYFYTI